MKQFTDSENRTWAIDLTIGTIKRLKNLLKVDLLRLEEGDPPLITRLGTDIEFLCDLIFAIIEPQAKKAGVTDEQFGSALGGSVIKAAQDALYEELVDFFRSLGRRDLMKMLSVQGQVIDKAVTQITTRIENLDIEAELAKIPGLRSTASPGSSASTPSP